MDAAQLTADRFTDEQKAFREAIRDFCDRELASQERLAELTEGFQHHHVPAVAEKLAELGWLGVSIPEQYGGAGGGMVEAAILLEETMRGQIPIAAYPVSLIVAGAYERFGTEQQKGEILPAIASGRGEAIAMSEPEAGSDVGNISCRAERRNGDYVINGQKTWISGAHIADHILVVARTDDSGGKHEGLSMISVPTDNPGVEVRGIDTMGGREVNDVFFTDCRVPADRLLGQENGGWIQLMAGLNVERLIIGALALGIAQRAFDDVLGYVKERRQFDRPIGSFQALRHRIADIATELEVTRLLVYEVAARVDANPEEMLPREASMAKLKAAEVAKATTLEAMQMMGGYGYASEYGMEQKVRAALVMPIYGGTSEIQREIISKTYGL